MIYVMRQRKDYWATFSSGFWAAVSECYCGKQNKTNHVMPLWIFPHLKHRGRLTPSLIVAV